MPESVDTSSAVMLFSLVSLTQMHTCSVYRDLTCDRTAFGDKLLNVYVSCTMLLDTIRLLVRHVNERWHWSTPITNSVHNLLRSHVELLTQPLANLCRKL